MKSLLVISKQVAIADAIRAAVDGTQVHIEHSPNTQIEETAPHVDAVLIETSLTGVKALNLIDDVQRIRPDLPIVMLVDAKEWQWEEDAYLRGVRHVISMPIRSAMITELLNRVMNPDGSPNRSLSQSGATSSPANPLRWRPESPASSGHLEKLESVREFNQLLTGGFEAVPLVRNFVALLRELLRVNRAAVFLVPPPDPVSGVRPRSVRQPLHCVESVGIAGTRGGNSPLSLERGIGAYLWKWGRALQAGSPESLADDSITREFNRLGIQLALPVLDGDDLIGVALLDGHLTGEPLSLDEVAILFRLFEGLGSAVHNCWEHERLATNHRLMSGVLADQAAGCMVIARNLQLLHWNRRAAELLSLNLEEGFSFRDLPQSIGSRIFETLTTGESPSSFRHTTDGDKPLNLELTVSAFQRKPASEVDAVLVTINDLTELDRAKDLELESARLRLIRAMSEGMAHEIGNCLVPLSTHQQLMDQKLDDEEFRSSLSAALTDGVRRISRLSSQMLYLTRERSSRAESVQLTPLVEEAFREMQSAVSDRKALLVCEGGSGFHVEANRDALKHALSEILLNALQASPADPQVQVYLEQVAESGTDMVRIQISDKGKGFTAEAAARATEAFFTTRNVGLGLGLTVAQKIAESHGGRLQVETGAKGGRVALFLPLAVPSAKPVPASKTLRGATAEGKGARKAAEVDN